MQFGLSNASDTTLSLFFNCMWYLISSENFTQSLEKKSFPDLYFCLVFVCLFEPVSWSSAWGWSDCATEPGLEPDPSSCLDLSDSGVTGMHRHAWPYFTISSTTTAPFQPPALLSLGAYILFTVFLRTFAFHVRPYLSSLCLSGSFFFL